MLIVRSCESVVQIVDCKIKDVNEKVTLCCRSNCIELWKRMLQ